MNNTVTISTGTERWNVTVTQRRFGCGSVSGIYDVGGSASIAAYHITNDGKRVYWHDTGAAATATGHNMALSNVV